MTTNHRDVIIVGGGAAGLSAGLVLARAQASVVLLDAGQPRNAPADEMHGFLSRDGISPADFLAVGREDVDSYGGVIRSAAVTSIDRQPDGTFAATLVDGTTEVALAVLVATGLTDQLPPLDGVRERWGTLVHHCPYCHGYEVRGKRIVVLGGSMRELSIKQAGLLRSYSDRVTFLTNGIEIAPLERERFESLGVLIREGVATQLVGEQATLDAVRCDDGSLLDCDAVFIAPPQRPNDTLLRALGCAVDPATDLVTVTQFGATSVPGVWAAGNVVTPTAQVITAAGAASASAIAINGWLLEKKIAAEEHARPAGGSAP